MPVQLKHHVFICTNERPEGHRRGCCMSKGGMELVQLFKEKLSQRGLKGQIRAQRAGCLDTCELGPSLVVYPEGVWYRQVQASDVDEIIESHLMGGRPVERLVIAGK